MLLAVTSLGLGACWINGLQHEHMCNDSVVLKLREKLDIENAFGVGCIAIGHPDSDSTIIKLTGNSVYEV